MNKTANFRFVWYAHNDSFSLDTGPIIFAKSHVRVILGWRMLSKVIFSCGFY